VKLYYTVRELSTSAVELPVSPYNSQYLPISSLHLPTSQVRELSTSAVELWALRALRGEVIIRSSAKAAGHTWLREHLRSNYTAAWHEVLALTNPSPKLPPTHLTPNSPTLNTAFTLRQVLASGEVDAAVQTPAFTTRWDNYWIEGILWLVRNLDIDGA